MQREEKVIMKSIALCFKPFLKAEEAMIYCNLERTQFAKKTTEFLVLKSISGYYRRDDLDRMMAGEMPSANNNR